MTRAGIASMDRQSKEKMHGKDTALKKKELGIKQQEADIKRSRMEAQNVRDAAASTKDLIVAGASINHPTWYKKFNLDQVTANLPQYTRIGQVMKTGWLSSYSNSAQAGIQSTDVVPGVCTIQLLSCLPNQTVVAGNGYVESPVNVGLSRFMAELRKMNSRIGDYDASDFGLYWYAAADFLFVLSKVCQGIRIYNTYFVSNAYYARSLIYAIGFDADDFFAHIQEYKVLLKKFEAIFNSSIVIPKNLTFILRRLWLANAIVRDHDGEKAQCYVFNFPYLGTLSEDETSVVFANYDSDKSYTAVENYLTLAARRLTDSVGLQTMMADLRAGIPDNCMLRIGFSLEMDKPVEFYDDTFNKEQIHNMRTCWGYWSTANGVTQSVPLLSLNIHAMTDGYICQGEVDSGHTTMTKAGPVVKISQLDAVLKVALNGDAEFINVYSPQVGEDDILESTRLRVISNVTDSEDSYDFIQFDTRGTEIPLRFDIWTLGLNGTTLFKVPFATTIVAVDDYQFNDLHLAIHQCVSRFDWIPPIKVANDDSARYFTFGEIDNYFPIANVNLKKLHEACSLSEFYIDSKEFSKQIR